MKNESHDQPGAGDPLDELLRDGAEYLPDDGFTRRVIKSLPVRRRSVWRRTTILSFALLGGGALAAWQWPEVLNGYDLLPDATQAISWQVFVLFILVLAALISFVCAGWAIFNEEQ